MKVNQSFFDLVNIAKQNINQLTVADVAKKLEKRVDFLLIDVREDREFEADHLPGAIHLGKGILERDIEKMISNKERELVLYCGGGFRSALAAESIQRMGYSNVWSMDGGYKGWVKAGHPTVTQTIGNA